MRNVADSEVKTEDKEIKINFYWRSGATHDEVVDILEEVVKKAKVDTNFGVLLFQNSIRNLARMNDEKLINELCETFKRMRRIISKQNENDFHHRLAIAEEQYAWELNDYFDYITFINDKIKEENKKHDTADFKLWKPQTKGARKSENAEGFLPKIANNRFPQNERIIKTKV